MKNLLFYTIFFCLNLSAQDTIKLEPSFHFSSEEFPNRGKSFAAKTYNKRATELIYFSKNHIRIEECYYYDLKRDCYGDTYKITSDSTIKMNSDEWHYIKTSNNYKVSRQLKKHIITGTATSLIPFTKSGEFYGINNQNDTLWQETFSRNNQNKFILPSTQLKSRIYEMDKLDIIPLINSNDTIPQIETDHISLQLCEGGIPIVFLSFIVTKQGKITNIEISGTNYEEDKVISLILSQYKNISPGIRNGKPVNSKYWLHCKLK